MTTVQLQTSFLRPVAGSQSETVGKVRIVARVLRAGKSLVFGEIQLFDPQDRLAVHSTTTYALL
jgi:acyl-coenzyme A thioesterase PaaI-like protein